MDQDLLNELERFRSFLRMEDDQQSAHWSMQTTARQVGGEYIRTLESIGRRICPEKPLCAKTVRKLIRLQGLPAVKHDMGWMVLAQDLEDWMVRMFMDGKE